MNESPVKARDMRALAAEDEAQITQVYTLVGGLSPALLVPPYEVLLGETCDVVVNTTVDADAEASHALRLTYALTEPNGNVVRQGTGHYGAVDPGGALEMGIPPVVVNQVGLHTLDLTLADDNDPTIEFQTLSLVIFTGIAAPAADGLGDISDMVVAFAPLLIIGMMIPMFKGMDKKKTLQQRRRPGRAGITEKGTKAAEQIQERGKAWARSELGLTDDEIEMLVTADEATLIKDLLEWPEEGMGELRKLEERGYVKFI